MKMNTRHPAAGRAAAERRAIESFHSGLSAKDRRRVSRLTNPLAIQLFLDGIPFSGDDVYRCPADVIRDNSAYYCYDGAVLGAALLRRLGHPPLILEMRPDARDFTHVIALYRREGHWGAVAKSSFPGLRFREPIFRSVRELVLSYFGNYVNGRKEKTLRSYTRPLDLARFDRVDWMTSSAAMTDIERWIDHRMKAIRLLTASMIRNLSPLDDVSFRAETMGALESELF
jgi:hypothetical protein